MKTITKGIIFGLAAFAMTGCNCLNLLPTDQGFDREAFIEQGKSLEKKSKNVIAETNTFTVKTTKGVGSGEPQVYTLTATRQTAYTWTSDETNATLKNELIAQEIFWESKAMYKIADLMSQSSTSYKDFLFEKHNDGTYAIEKVNSERMEFNSDGILTEYRSYYPSGDYTYREYTFAK